MLNLSILQRRVYQELPDKLDYAQHHMYQELPDHNYRFSACYTFLKFNQVHLNKQTQIPNGMLTLSLQKVHKKYLFRLLINLYIQTKHHPVAVSKWGGGRKNPKSIHFYKHACTYICYFCTCNKILIFTNKLQVSIADTFYCKF